MQITNIRPLSEVLLVIDGAHKSSRLGPVWTMVLLMSRPWVVLPVKGPRAAQMRSTCPDEEGAAALHDSQDLKVSKERWWLLTCLKKANLGPLSPGYLEKTGESTAAVPLMRVSPKERRQVWAFPSARFKRHSLWAWWAGVGMEESQGLQETQHWTSEQIFPVGTGEQAYAIEENDPGSCVYPQRTKSHSSDWQKIISGSRTPKWPFLFLMWLERNSDIMPHPLRW